MRDTENAVLVGAVVVGIVLAVLVFQAGPILWKNSSVLMEGKLWPGSKVTNITALIVLLAGLMASVSMITLALIEGSGQRSSGKMLRESKLKAKSGMPGMEELRELHAREDA